MVGFELSKAVNANNVFLVKHSELEGRLDSYFYKPDFYELDKKLIKNNNVRFCHLIKSILNGYDFRDYKEFGTPYIKVANVKQGEFDFRKIQYIDFDSDEISKSIQLKKGNLLLTRKGTFGNALSLEKNYDFVISSEVFYIELTEQINSKYLEIFFNSALGQKQFDRNKIGAIMGSLSQEAVKSIKIPLPTLDFQENIVETHQAAYLKKQQKEVEAQALLDGIDGYLLNELGITLPQQDNRLEKRIFTVSFSEVAGGRIDPKLYDLTTKGIRSAIRTSLFKQKSLKELITHSSAGDWGDDEFDELSNDYLKCLVVRATEFDNEYNLKLDNSRVKYRLIHRDRLKFIDVKANDLLIEKSGGSIDQPVGRIALVTEEYIAEHQLCYSNFIHKIRVNQSVASPEYLFYYLKLMHNIKLTEAMQSQTNGIRNLIMSSYFNQMVVLPEFKRQNEIATHISQIRAQAKQLQLEAAQVLATAKAEIERMILGEA